MAAAVCLDACVQPWGTMLCHLSRCGRDVCPTVSPWCSSRQHVNLPTTFPFPLTILVFHTLHACLQDPAEEQHRASGGVPGAAP